MKKYLAAAAVLLCAAGLLRAAPAAPPDGAALVQRYRELAACRMRLKIDMNWGGAPVQGQQATATLLFRRPGNLRVDWDGFRQAVQFVRTPRQHRAYFPQEGAFRDLSETPFTGPLWNSFANAPRSLAALLEPGAVDRQMIDGIWAPSVRYLGTGQEGGAEWWHYRARGAGGGKMEFWVSPVDRLIHRLVLTNSRYENGKVELRMQVDGLDRPAPDAAFNLRIPAAARNADRGEPGESDGPVSVFSGLRRRMAAAPQDPAAVRALVEALQQYGRSAEALRLSLELARRQNTAQNAELVARCYQQMGAGGAAVDTFLKALARFGTAARFGEQPGELARIAAAAGRGDAVAPALEKQLNGRSAVGSLRVELALLYRALGRHAEAAREYGRILDPLPAGTPGAATQWDFVGPLMGDVPRLAAHLDAVARRELAVKLERAEGKLIEIEPMALLPAYLALGDVSAAERLADEFGDAFGVSVGVFGAIAEASARSGSPEVQRLFREAMVAAVEMEPQENAGVAQLLSQPHARGILAPVLRRLAEQEQKDLPLQSAHWLFFAGDNAAAARRYAAFLGSPAGSPETATGTDRLTARILGERCARQAGETALADQFLLDAGPDLLLMRADLTEPYPTSIYTRLLLNGAGASVRRQFLDQLAGTQPDLIIQWAQQGGRGWGGGPSVPELRSEEARAILLKVAASTALSPGDKAALVPLLQERGMLREAAELAARVLRQGGGVINPYQLVSLAGQLESGAREEGETPKPSTRSTVGGASAPKPSPLAKALIDALEAAVRQRLGWEEGQAALAQWYSSHDAKRAVALLAARARQRGTAQAYGELAQAEIAASQPKQALAHLEQALRLAPKQRFPLEAQYVQALQGAGKRNEAIAGWRRLSASAQTPDQISQVVSGLRGLGREAEAFEFLEARYRSGRFAERYPGEVDSLRQQLAERFREKKQFDRLAALYPELGLFELDVEPEALRRLNINVPAEVWRLVIARLDREHRPVAAFNAFCAFAGSGAGAAALDELVARARKIGRLALARDAFCTMATGEDAPENAARVRRLTIRGGAEGVRWARLEEDLGRAGVALAIYNKILHRDREPFPHAGPGVAEAAQRAGDLVAAQGRAEEAERLRRWAKAFSEFDAASQQQGEKALAMLRHAQGLFPESPCFHAAVVRLLPEEQRAGARLRALELMVPVYDGVRDCASCLPLVRRDEAGPPLPAAALLAATHDAGGARYLIALEATLREAGYDPPALARRAAEWRKVVDKDPSVLPAWEALRELANQTSDTDLMIEASRKVAELRRDNADDWMQLANAYLRTNRRNEAREVMEKAHELDPRYDPAEYGLSDPALQIWGMQPWSDEGDNVAMLFQFTPYYGLVSNVEPW